MPRFRIGRGFGRSGGRGRMGGPFAAGVGGTCVYEVSHRAGIPCYQINCSKCGSPMVRKR